MSLEKLTPTKTYLSDGVYAEVSGECIVLTTENGYDTTNWICLDQPALQCLDGLRNKFFKKQEG